MAKTSTPRFWKPEDIAYLRMHWQTMPWCDIAAHVGRTERALRRAESTPKPEKFKMPTKMSAAIRARMEKERFAYTPETLPWRAERMLGPVYVPTGMAYRGQRA